MKLLIYLFLIAIFVALWKMLSKLEVSLEFTFVESIGIDLSLHTLCVLTALLLQRLYSIKPLNVRLYYEYFKAINACRIWFLLFYLGYGAVIFWTKNRSREPHRFAKFFTPLAEQVQNGKAELLTYSRVFALLHIIIALVLIFATLRALSLP